MWETVDPDGRRVVLTFERWRHIVWRHAELADDLVGVLAAVAEPQERLSGGSTLEEWYYRREIGPSRWVKVVVHYEEGEGRIVTAFPRRLFP